MSFVPRPSGPDNDPARKAGSAGAQNSDDAADKNEGTLGSFWNRIKIAALTPPTDADAFLRLVKRGDTAAITAAIKAGMSPNAKNAKGETAAHIAAREDRADIIELLAQAGADLRAGTTESATRTPLQDAINFGKGQAAAALIACGGAPENVLGTQELLQRACEKDMADVITAFHRAGVDMRLPTQLQVTPMMAAINAKKSAAVGALMQARDVIGDLNAPLPGDADGRTLFHLAVMRADAPLVGAMIEGGAFVNPPRADGMTPLLLAIQRGDAALVAVLLRGGADACRAVTAGTQEVQPSPLLYLCGMRNMNDQARARIAEMLIEAGADVHARNAAGEGVLHRLMTAHNTGPTLAALLRAGVDVNTQSRAGDTPLMLAIEKATIHEVADLLSAGADVNARHSRDARTPLMIAAALGQADTLKELLDAGANVRLLDNTHHSALYYANANIRQRSNTVPILEEALRRNVKPLFRGSVFRNRGNNGGAP